MEHDISKFRWFPTCTHEAIRFDDVWFTEPDVGWAVNSNGEIVHTHDGGATWHQQLKEEGLWMRSICFSGPRRGWVGATQNSFTHACPILFHTSNGQDWHRVENLPPEGPRRICGLWPVNGSVIYASGTAVPEDGAAMMRTFDGGRTWTGWDMSAWAKMLVGVYFKTPLQGWVVGGRESRVCPRGRGSMGQYDSIKPVILMTEDGGQTWHDLIADLDFPCGSWGWKIQFVNDRLAFVSIEAGAFAMVLRSEDGGLTWTKIPVVNPLLPPSLQNKNIEGVGFINREVGWVGGWGNFASTAGTSSGTTNGGATWQRANEIGRFINQFRFYGEPLQVGYASGRQVYKFSPEVPMRCPIRPPEALKVEYPKEGEVAFVYQGTSETDVRRPRLTIWDHFTRLMAAPRIELVSDQEIRWIWRLRDRHGRRVRKPGFYFWRLTVGGETTSGGFEILKLGSEAASTEA